MYNLFKTSVYTPSDFTLVCQSVTVHNHYGLKKNVVSKYLKDLLKKLDIKSHLINFFTQCTKIKVQKQLIKMKVWHPLKDSHHLLPLKTVLHQNHVVSRNDGVGDVSPKP